MNGVLIVMSDGIGFLRYLRSAVAWATVLLARC
jgi:hypothetical protein